MTVVHVQPVCHGESKEERDLLDSPMSGAEDGGGENEDRGDKLCGGEIEVDEMEVDGMDEQRRMMMDDCEQLLGRVLEGKLCLGDIQFPRR